MKPSTSPVNLLLICTDHWPGPLLGCVGHPAVQTPTLDYLARTGIRFDRFYSTCPVCIPARRSMMTGLTHKTHGDRVYSDRMPMPPVTTLAQAFRNQGYQAYAVGKLHVHPQRSRIGFDDVILMEEGRYEFGGPDDYQIWLGSEGHAGEEFLHGMGNNTYYTRTWHLPEAAHPTAWTTQQMAAQIKRRDPDRPAFWYCSYVFPHPPLVPLGEFWQMYEDIDIPEPLSDGWDRDHEVFQAMADHASLYTPTEIRRARRAFYAQCTHIDYQLRVLIGTLREEKLLDSTIIAFTSDHGDMLFDHGIVGKRCFYEGSACVPFLLSGKPLEPYQGMTDHRLAASEDLMPTLLGLCGLPIPGTVEGLDLSIPENRREYLYGEIGEEDDAKTTRMICDEQYKLIYYPYGNVSQLFDIKADPAEQNDLAAQPSYSDIRKQLEARLVSCLYGSDLAWTADGRLIGLPSAMHRHMPNYGLFSQRGWHWPPPQ